MSNIRARLRATQLDKDNFPRMKSERNLPVELALEAADEIERLEAYVEEWKRRYETARLAHEKGHAEIERLRAEFELFRESPSKLEVAQYEIEKLRDKIETITSPKDGYEEAKQTNREG